MKKGRLSSKEGDSDSKGLFSSSKLGNKYNEHLDTSINDFPSLFAYWGENHLQIPNDQAEEKLKTDAEILLTHGSNLEEGGEKVLRAY